MVTKFLTILIILSVSTLGLGIEKNDNVRIEYLIHAVENDPGVIFIRNGKSYDGKSAGSHLRRKLRYMGGQINTAEDFINKIASKSSVSNQKYRVRLADGSEIDSETYFFERLKQFDEH